MKILLVAVNAKYIHTNPALYSLKEYALSHAVSRSSLRNTRSTICRIRSLETFLREIRT